MYTEQLKPHLNMDVNLGQLLTISVLLGGFIYTYSGLASSVTQNDQARLKYVPILEALVTNSATQAERIRLQEQTIVQMQNLDAKISETLNRLSVDIAIIKTTVAQKEGIGVEPTVGNP